MIKKNKKKIYAINRCTWLSVLIFESKTETNESIYVNLFLFSTCTSFGVAFEFRMLKLKQ